MGSAVTDPRATAMPTNPPSPVPVPDSAPPPSPLGPRHPRLALGGPRHPRRARGGRRRALARSGTGGLALVIGLAVAVSGCTRQPVASGPRMELATATVYSSQGGSSASPVDAYLVIRNNGAVDRLVAAHSSAGGTITLSGPAAGNPADMRAVSGITVPGHTLIRLVPNGYHLVITNSGRMKSGTEITLTLRFAHAGTYQVAAEVTNPQTGGSSYFLN
jgi:copper(I)-binding protein